MDADYHENENDPNMFVGRKRKGRSRFARVVAQKKPVFDPSKSSIKKETVFQHISSHCEES